MTSITPVEDASTYLVAPTAEGHGDYIWKLRASAGIIVGSVDAVCEWLTGFSPLNEWVVKPFGGDWKAFDKGAAAWKNAGKAAHSIELNLRSVPGQVGDAWQGVTSDAFKQKHVQVADSIAELPEACDALGEMCSALGELARTIGEFVVEVLKELAERVLKITGVLSSVVASPAAGPMVGELVVKIFGWSKKIADLINKFVSMITKIVKIADKIIKVITKLWKIIKPLLEFQHANSTLNGALAGAGSGGGGGGGGGGGF